MPSDRPPPAGEATRDEPTGAVDRSHLLGLLSLVRALGARTDLHQLLQAIATGVVAVLGFDAVAVNLVGPSGDLRVVAVEGPEEIRALRGRVTDRAVVDALIARSAAWGSLRFVEHRPGEGDSAAPARTAAGTGAAGRTAWHPRDVLLAPMRSTTGRLLGILSVDRPRDGRRPTPEQCLMLELIAAHGANAIEGGLVRTELADSVATYRAAFDGAPVGIAVLDGSLNVVAANPAFGRLVGVPDAALPATPLADLLDPGDTDAVVGACLSALGDTSATPAVEHRFLARDGSASWARSSARRVRDTTAVDRVILRSDDITADRRARAELREQSVRDALTGLANRRAALEQIGAALEGRRPGQTVGVMLLDLDGFGQLNDMHGHRAGDAVLVGVAQLLRATLRAGERLFRLGGDEFVVLCEQVGSWRGAQVLAERLVASLADTRLAPGQVATTASIGIGLASDASPLSSPVELLAAAEQALHEAQRGGRGRWHGPAGGERRSAGGYRAR